MGKHLQSPHTTWLLLEEEEERGGVLKYTRTLAHASTLLHSSHTQTGFDK